MYTKTSHFGESTAVNEGISAQFCLQIPIHAYHGLSQALKT
jgi:hypothetical protein